MRATLIRHGEAGDDAARDEARALTMHGRADVRRVARSLAQRGGQFSVIVSSPLVRAVQTAEIVAAEFGYLGAVVISDALVPEAGVAEARAFLASLPLESSVALVAHEPILSTLAGALVGNPRFPALRKAEAVRIRLHEGPAKAGVLRWRIDPDTGRRKES
jgi:phosphohistidine phosphatase